MHYTCETIPSGLFLCYLRVNLQGLSHAEPGQVIEKVAGVLAIQVLAICGERCLRGYGLSRKRSRLDGGGLASSKFNLSTDLLSMTEIKKEINLQIEARGYAYYC